LSPFAVTATGCQCLKPTLAPSRSVKSVLCGPAGPSAGSRNGGLSSTPSLTRWLLISQLRAKMVSVGGVTYALTAGTLVAFPTSFNLIPST
jgi:hypothetical protein